MKDKQDMDSIRLAICGFGEIATNAHLPAIQQSNQFWLVAIIEPNLDSSSRKKLLVHNNSNTSIQFYTNLSDCLQDTTIVLDAVAVCTPSSITLDLAEQALRAGKHVLVEKPPGDYRRLAKAQELAKSQSLAFFTAYHTAHCVGLPNAQQWLSIHGKSLHDIQVTWKESARKWHPGQDWITRKHPNSYCEGVLDIVFNPLSLLVTLLGPLHLESATLEVPANWETPISGTFQLTAASSNKKVVPIRGEFAWDYEHNNEEIWTIDFYTTTSFSSRSTLSLREGGCQAYIDGHRVTTEPTADYPLKPEYDNLYRTLARLIQTKSCSVDDVTPRLVQEVQEQAIRTACGEYYL